MSVQRHKRGAGNGSRDEIDSTELGCTDTTADCINRTDLNQYELSVCRQSFWFRVGDHIMASSTRAWYTVGAVTMLFFAFLYPAVTFNKAAGPVCFFPTGTSEHDLYVHFSDLFGAGRLTPYVVVVEAPNRSVIQLVNATFAAQQALVSIHVDHDGRRHGSSLVQNGTLFDASPLFGSGDVGPYSTVCTSSCGLNRECGKAIFIVLSCCRLLRWFPRCFRAATCVGGTAKCHIG
eukprot:m.1555653 g.1555653  ORF g.1555653 m.1555653 type:complete len:234 (+) comp25270_c1_seq103:328-1029(+)